MAAAEEAGPDPPSLSLEDKVRFLCSPSAYAGLPAPPDRVAAVETHMSFVFLAGDEAYKLKKPAKTPFLDFSTPEARLVHCLEEVRLNRRLAPGVYLGVAALTLNGNDAHGLALNGPGVPLDWLVRMRRLPEERMMDRLIRLGGLTREDVRRLCRHLTGFYRGLEPAEIAPKAYLERFRHQHALNMAVLEASLPDEDRGMLGAVAAAVEAFLDRDARLILDRAESGKVVEGHGDLRPEHVCLAEPPAVIDSLEFNRFLRLVDPFEEAASLGLECARLGGAWAGEALGECLEGSLDDRPAGKLKAFHTAFRAILRAQLAMTHLREPSPRTPELWPALAREYLILGMEATRELA